MLYNTIRYSTVRCDTIPCNETLRHSLIRYTVWLSAGTLLGSHLNPLTLDFESSAGDFWWNNTTVFCAFQTIIVNTYISTSLLLVYHTSFKLFASVFGEPFGKPYCFSPVWPAAVPSRESSVTVKFLAASFKGEVVRVGRMDHYQTPRSMERCRPFFFFFHFFFFPFFLSFPRDRGARVTVGQCKAGDGSGMCE